MNDTLNSVGLSQVLLSEKTCRTGRLSRLANVNEATVWRWFTKGVVVNGERIILESCFVGGVRLSSEEAMTRFSQRITSARGGRESNETKAKPISFKSRQKQSDEAGRKLEKMRA